MTHWFVVFAVALLAGCSDGYEERCSAAASGSSTPDHPLFLCVPGSDCGGGYPCSPFVADNGRNVYACNTQFCDVEGSERGRADGQTLVCALPNPALPIARPGNTPAFFQKCTRSNQRCLDNTTCILSGETGVCRPRFCPRVEAR